MCKMKRKKIQFKYEKILQNYLKFKLFFFRFRFLFDSKIIFLSRNCFSFYTSLQHPFSSCIKMEISFPSICIHWFMHLADRVTFLSFSHAYSYIVIPFGLFPWEVRTRIWIEKMDVRKQYLKKKLFLMEL